MVGLGRLELPTSPLSGARSSHLSYRPIEHRRNSVYDAPGGFATVYEHRFCVNASNATQQNSQSRRRRDTGNDDCSQDETISGPDPKIPGEFLVARRIVTEVALSVEAIDGVRYAV